MILFIMLLLKQLSKKNVNFKVTISICLIRRCSVSDSVFEDEAPDSPPSDVPLPEDGDKEPESQRAPSGPGAEGEEPPPMTPPTQAVTGQTPSTCWLP